MVNISFLKFTIDHQGHENTDMRLAVYRQRGNNYEKPDEIF